MNYLLYQGKDNLINHDKITLLNDIFNYLVFSDFYSYTDSNGNELDKLKQHMKKQDSIHYWNQHLKVLFNEIKENQDKIDDYNHELQEILKGSSPQDREEYIGVLERCKGSCFPVWRQ